MATFGATSNVMRACQSCHPQPAAIPRPAEPSPPLRQRARAAAAVRRPEPRGQRGFWTRLEKSDVAGRLSVGAILICRRKAGPEVLYFLPPGKCRPPIATPNRR